MPKVTHVKSARAVPVPRKCRQCGHEIAVGEAYKHFTKRFSPTVFFCSEHSPKGSDLVGGKAGDLLRIGEDLDDSLNGAETVEDIESALDTAVQEANDLAEQLAESASNIEDGFGHSTMMSEEIQGRADEIETWVGELESAKDDCQAEDEPEEPGDEPSKSDFTNEREYEDAHDSWEEVAAAHAEWEGAQEDMLDNARQVASDAGMSIPG